MDGFLPAQEEELLVWVQTDKRGFPYWHERNTFTLSPNYPMLDLISEKDSKSASFIYTAEIFGKESLGLLHGLSVYHLIDEIIVYVLPITSGKGITHLQQLLVGRWQLHKSTVFRNGVCRLIYRKILQ
ncbi:dihydrofolate reductase family protein [Bacteroides uniformis]|uniref:Dihydrofolate reductase family protein n=1 Tax=Bacteroides uniformis TaxID=820 RepID=A0A6I0LTB6_BACUN|nr:dihydrofolate reductase family protein [Bacteroides uniformis]KAB4254146.1 dihydrofolate reductase family protein [Bacteroides uniformis]KAB4257713.1 dihydrofolate reductase family protein [Bacteroides uniformis]KAB4260201.1 dihydrofolate reductase family protein [Bacteroides uniformis]